MRKIYEMSAMAAYTNCLELLDEANILYRHSKFPRAYALAILSAEELAKSYFFKCSSIGLNPNILDSKRLNYHEKKIHQVIKLLAHMYIFSKYSTDILVAIQLHKRQSDNQNQLALSLVREAITRGMESEPVVELFIRAYNFRVKAFYVDVVDGQLSVPSEVISVKRCKEALDFMNEWFRGFDIILNSDDETFRKIIMWLEPLDNDFDQ